MKKEDIAMIRILSVAGVCLLNICLLFCLIGGNIFRNIVNDINSNAYELSDPRSSIYNLYYYMGLDVIYRILFSITLLLLAVATLAIIFRINYAGKVAFMGNVCSLICGCYLLLARIFEGSKGVHAFIDGFYMSRVFKSSIVTCRLLPKFPIAFILLIILSAFGMAMVKTSGILKLKMYNKNTPFSVRNIIIPALTGYLLTDVIRRVVFNLINTRQTDNNIIYDYIKDYYIGNKVFFNWSQMIMIIVCVCITTVFRDYKKEPVKMLVSIGVPSLITVIPSVIYAYNPPSLFGFLTLDISLCDAVDNAFELYLTAYCVAMIMIYFIVYYNINMKININMTIAMLAVNLAISTIFMMIFKNSISKMFIVWAFCDVLVIAATYAYPLVANRKAS